MRRFPGFLSVLLGIVLLAGTSFAQAPSTPDSDPENTLLMRLKDGVVVIEMRPDLAPNHVKRIKALVRKGFYDGNAFHRVIAGLLAQTGDPTGTGQGGSGKSIDAEFSGEPHVRGTVAMARADDPDSADSQFYIMMRPLPSLDGMYTVWGRVIRGMEFVDNIKPGTLPNGVVVNPDKIISMKIKGDTLKRPPKAHKS
jgi:peptidylprolyl isomerase